VYKTVYSERVVKRKEIKMFSNVKTYSQLIAAERRDNTSNGNAVYFITMEDGTTGRTERDAMWVCGFSKSWEGLEVAYDVRRNKNGSYTFTDIKRA
tara:strand:- start:184 stop:471 length:288 start_codon:yes stop_codon:yes gene_type:complete